MLRCTRDQAGQWVQLRGPRVSISLTRKRTGRLLLEGFAEKPPSKSTLDDRNFSRRFVATIERPAPGTRDPTRRRSALEDFKRLCEASRPSDRGRAPQSSRPTQPGCDSVVRKTRLLRQAERVAPVDLRIMSECGSKIETSFSGAGNPARLRQGRAAAAAVPRPREGHRKHRRCRTVLGLTNSNMPPAGSAVRVCRRRTVRQRRCFRSITSRRTRGTRARSDPAGGVLRLPGHGLPALQVKSDRDVLRACTRTIASAPANRVDQQAGVGLRDHRRIRADRSSRFAARLPSSTPPKP